MARGGVRANAGRKTGAVSRVKAAQKEAVSSGGETPLDYMLRVMRDTSVDHERRDDMAKAAAPYAHSKLAAMQVTGADGGPLTVAFTTVYEQDSD